MSGGDGYRFYSTADLPLRADEPGVRLWGVALERSMLTYFELEPDARFPLHRHESEQITLVLSGKLLFEVEGDEIVVGPGEVIALASNTPHAVRSLKEPVRAVDAWSPPRERYRGS